MIVKACLAKHVRSLRYHLSGLRHQLNVVAELPRVLSGLKQTREYARELRSCAPTEKAAGSCRLRLGVVAGYPILDYTVPAPIRRLNVGYPLYIHGFRCSSDVVRVCRACDVNVLRAYDPINGQTAIEAGRLLSVPVIVSVH